MDQFMEIKTVKDNGNEIIADSEALQSMINELDSIISALKSNWQDEAYNQFVQLYQQKKPTLENFVKVLKNYGNRAIEHASDIEAGAQVL